jgi:hypothetical protein
MGRREFIGFSGGVSAMQMFDSAGSAYTASLAHG